MNSNKKSFDMRLFAVIAYAGLLFAGLYMWQSASTGTQKSTPSVVPSTQQKVSGAKMWLDTRHGKVVYTAGEEFDILLHGDSVGTAINGYDALIPLDATTQFVKGVGTESAFTLKTTKNAMGLSVTGVIPLDKVTTGMVVGGQSLADLTFSSSKPGPTRFALSFTPGETGDSNLVSISPPEDILSSVEGVTVYVGQSATVTQKAPRTLQKEGIRIAISSIDSPEETCADCRITYRVTFTRNGETVEKEFAFGGIDGQIVDSAEVFGYIFEAEDAGNNALTLSYASLN